MVSSNRSDEIEDDLLELTPEETETAMRDPEQLKKWLRGRQPWMIMNNVHLVDSLEWPQQVTNVQEMVHAYGAHRAQIPIPYLEPGHGRHPVTGEPIEQAIMHLVTPSAGELEDLIKWINEVAMPAAIDREAREAVRAKKSRRR